MNLEKLNTDLWSDIKKIKEEKEDNRASSRKRLNKNLQIFKFFLETLSFSLFKTLRKQFPPNIYCFIVIDGTIEITLQ